MAPRTANVVEMDVLHKDNFNYLLICFVGFVNYQFNMQSFSWLASVAAISCCQTIFYYMTLIRQDLFPPCA